MSEQSAFLRLDGGRIVSLAHIVAADFEPAQPARVVWDDDHGKDIELGPKRARLVITLTALEIETEERDFNSGFHLAAASSSQTRVLFGPQAVAVWEWLERLAWSVEADGPDPAGVGDKYMGCPVCQTGLVELAGPVNKCPNCGAQYDQSGACLAAQAEPSPEPAGPWAALAAGLDAKPPSQRPPSVGDRFMGCPACQTGLVELAGAVNKCAECGALYDQSGARLSAAQPHAYGHAKTAEAEACFYCKRAGAHAPNCMGEVGKAEDALAAVDPGAFVDMGEPPAGWE